ncbi:DUF3667 domain-containing protein [Psychroserpens sp. SPM9]|uniref:DUF3667 domain-containing protein n=1 Tax=Psychroserpens sp. SPM9 TaxID=2975598 RepID=UPI0021A86759|nr:DUF3667 domain-containing protein [Psychroserpens sp. SPM9]MDG5491999.1 DUF3667 domain-containing protein [Psychroserpens sp. SPM9]
MKRNNCNNCGTDFEGNFCFNCGQINSANNRLAFSNIVKDFFDNTFNIHKGFFYTFWNLIIQPSTVSKSYIQGKRKTYTNPTRYLVIALAALATMLYWTQSNDVIVNDSFQGFSFLSEQLNKSMRLWDLRLLTDWTLLGNLIEALVFPFGFYLLFRKLKYNYSELLVLSFYLISNSIFIVILLDGLPKLLIDFHVPVVFVFGAIIIYYSYALINFFKDIPLLKRIFFILIGLIIFVLLRFFLIPLILAILFPI